MTTMTCRIFSMPASPAGGVAGLGGGRRLGVAPCEGLVGPVHAETARAPAMATIMDRPRLVLCPRRRLLGMAPRGLRQPALTVTDSGTMSTQVVPGANGMTVPVDDTKLVGEPSEERCQVPEIS